jgi:hypothetical protein
MSDFYVGYLPKAPADVSRFVRRVVVGLTLLAMVIALLLTRGQGPFAASVFEFGKVRSFEGVVATQPYPRLQVIRPSESGQPASYSQYLLVAPGKFGAGDLVAGWDGKSVRLRGQLIYRGGRTMVQIEPGSIVRSEADPVAPEAARDLGSITLTGEIVDSKCYLGVMNPGSGKVHRDCAARCLSGGIPPILVTADGREQFLLAGPEGRALGRDTVREFVAEPISIRGERWQLGDYQVLRFDPSTLRHQNAQPGSVAENRRLR